MARSEKTLKFSSEPELPAEAECCKDRYQELVGILTEKIWQTIKLSPFGQLNLFSTGVFLAGIRGGESSWFSSFNTSEPELQLNIVATDHSTAHWVMIFENKALKKNI